MKLISLLKAVLTDDMNMFKYTTKKNSSKLKKILMPLFLFVIVSVSIGVYAYMIASKLHPYHLTYIMLTMFLFVVTIITFMEEYINLKVFYLKLKTMIYYSHYPFKNQKSYLLEYLNYYYFNIYII